MRSSYVALASLVAAICLFAFSTTNMQPLRVRHLDSLSSASHDVVDAAHRVQNPTTWSHMQTFETLMNSTTTAALQPPQNQISELTRPHVSVPAHVMPYVVIGVATSPKNTGHRTWIRNTWMTLQNVRAGTVHAVFLIGLLTPGATAHPPAVRKQLRTEREFVDELLCLRSI